MAKINPYITIILAITVCVLACWRGCDSKVVKFDHLTEPIKERVILLKSEKEKQKDSIIYRDVIRTKYLVMWKEVRHDSITPCETKLLVCDTLILRDSALISSLRAVIKTDSLIILSQDSIIRIDSIALRSNKKFWKGFKWGFGVGALTTGILSNLPKR